MNLNKFRQQVKNIGELSGFTLTTEEKFRVEEYILELSKQ